MTGALTRWLAHLLPPRPPRQGGTRRCRWKSAWTPLGRSSTTPANLPAVLAARSAIILVSTPLGAAIGGPLVGALGAAGTLLLSGVLTVALAAAARLLWVEEDAPRARRPRERSGLPAG